MKKIIRLDGLDQPVVLARRKGTRAIRLSVASNGTIRHSVPYGIPEFAAKKFAQKKVEWIKKHHTAPAIIRSGAHIGKSHTLTVEYADVNRPNTKVGAVDIRVRIPRDLDPASKSAQQVIKKACEKALLQEAQNLLPQRIAVLSKQHGLPYTTVSVKKLKSRWGACDSKNNISLNSYLIQLEWDLIDYVLCHELAHTVHHNHSDDFWTQLTRMLPLQKQLRIAIKTQPTDVITA